MAGLDIGIDLGTATIIVYVVGKGIVLKEPSVVAMNTNTGKILSVGEEAHKMLGKTPDAIRAVKPMADGVIADYELTEQMIKYFLKKVCRFQMFKPRMVLCVPSAITTVESKAAVEAAVNAGARKVYLIEEPVAAAIGAGIDVSKPQGRMILDIGGGTTDIAVISLNGIVTKTSIKVAGNKFDRVIAKYVKDKYSVVIGDKTAENIKIQVASVSPYRENKELEVKGHNTITGLPNKITVSTEDTYKALYELGEQIVDAIKRVLEVTPPELSADIHTNGIIMTGGGALLRGLDELIKHKLGINTYMAPDPVNCVAKGTGMAFNYINDFEDGFFRAITYEH